MQGDGTFWSGAPEEDGVCGSEYVLLSLQVNKRSLKAGVRGRRVGEKLSNMFLGSLPITFM